MKILNQENFCRHWCNDYDKVIKEQIKECKCIVACSSSENGMNPDILVAQRLMIKIKEKLFKEALVNFGRVVTYSFNEYNKGKKYENKLQFVTWWKKEGNEFLESIRNK